MSDPVVLLSTGDVVGPAGGVTDNSMVLFSGTSGKLIRGNNAVVTAAGLAILDDVNAAAQRVTLGLGTAATATLTTSATDTTAGRVLKVGDFGLGAIDLLDNASDLNTISATGFYLVTGANQPVGLGAGFLIVTTNVTLCTQRYIPQGGSREFIRSGTLGGTWSTWVEVWTTFNLFKTASATDTTAGSMLKVGDFGLGLDAVAVADANTVPASGFYRLEAGRGVNGPIPNLHFTLVNYRYGTTSGAQIATRVGGPPVQTWVRTQQSNVWSAWQEIALTNSPTFTGVPSAPTASAGTNTTQLANTAFVKAAVDDAPRVGVGQTWQDVTGSRGASTNYTNTTGKPIEVSVSFSYVGQGTSYIVVNGVVVNSFTHSLSGTGATMSAIVPNGSVYSAVGNKVRWTELR